MLGRSSTSAGRPRTSPLLRQTDLPHRLSAALTLLALSATALGAISGCRPEPAERRGARDAVERFARALRAGDEAALRNLATCVVEHAGVQDARFRYFEPVRFVRAAFLDSLATLLGEAHRIADSLYLAAPDSAGDLEARFERARGLARRASAARAASRAAARSAAGTATVAGEVAAGESVGLTTLRAHLLVRYAGAAVGPAPVERDAVVRLLRAAEGPWIVYAYDLAGDAPGPLPF